MLYLYIDRVSSTLVGMRLPPSCFPSRFPRESIVERVGIVTDASSHAQLSTFLTKQTHHRSAQLSQRFVIIMLEKIPFR